MANLVRLVACLAILVGLVGEVSLGLVLPSRIKLQYPSAQIVHVVQVDLPTFEQAAPWCDVAFAKDRWGRPGIGCDFIQER